MSQESKAVAEAIVEPKKIWKDRIPTLIAITTLILAVCATLSSFKAGGYSTKMILSQSQASDQWAFYQAKSIKETAYQTQRDALELARQSYPQLESAYKTRISDYDKEVARYKKEKSEIMEDAKKLEAARDQYQKHGARFGEALILLQIGILLSSLASISKNHVYWYGGALAGAGGVSAFVYALAMAP
ncbi:MAG: DUF4337 domain-containing protein [Negativicutes bacterium]